MFDVAWSELALIAAVALIVIGPKDLPRVMRSLGQWTRRARMMAAEFQRNLDEMMRDAELQELRKEVESISPSGFAAKVEEMIDVKGMEQAMKLDPDPTPPPATTEAPVPPETTAAPAVTAAEPRP